MSAESRPALEELTFETAESLATLSIPVATASTSIDALRGLLAGSRYAYAGAAAICDQERLVGLVRIEDVLAAAGDTLLSELMDSDPPSVSPGSDQEVAAWKAVQHAESILAVIDEDGRFRGVIPPQRLLGVLLQEHDEDLARLAGVVRGTADARSALEEAVFRRLWHRLPWLMIGLLGTFLAADIVNLFERRLQEQVLLAFFIPAVVYLADAVGTQTEALIIRGLSVGVTVRQVVVRELVTGAFAGFALAAAFFPIGWLRWGDPAVAGAVALALLAGCSTATIVALSLPWLFHALGKDPAFGSGPLATIAQNLLSILLYFSIATLIVG